MEAKGRDVLAKDRILDKAEELFAQNGYFAVSIRQITAAAECNLAAVNYHFGNKKNLYLEVFRLRWIPRARRIHDTFIGILGTKNEPSLRDILHSLATAFIEGPLTDDERERHHQLIARELAKPIGGLDIVASQIHQPFFNELSDLVKECLPEGQNEQELMLKLFSVFSMLTFFNFSRELVTIITNYQYDQAFKARLVNHIADSCSSGIAYK